MQRASELDAAGAAVTDLRAAAAEAGISPQAFDAALAELRDAERGRALDAHRPRAPRARRRILGLGLGLLVAVGAFYWMRRAVPTPVDGATAAEMRTSSHVLNCLSAQDAAALIRPLFDLPANTIEISSRAGARVLTFRATDAQLLRVQQLLGEQDRAGSAACAVPPPAATAPTPPPSD